MTPASIIAELAENLAVADRNNVIVGKPAPSPLDRKYRAAALKVTEIQIENMLAAAGCRVCRVTEQAPETERPERVRLAGEGYSVEAPGTARKG